MSHEHFLHGLEILGQQLIPHNANPKKKVVPPAQTWLKSFDLSALMFSFTL